MGHHIHFTFEGDTYTHLTIKIMRTGLVYSILSKEVLSTEKKTFFNVGDNRKQSPPNICFEIKLFEIAGLLELVNNLKMTHIVYLNVDGPLVPEVFQAGPYINHLVVSTECIKYMKGFSLLSLDTLVVEPQEEKSKSEVLTSLDIEYLNINTLNVEFKYPDIACILNVMSHFLTMVIPGGSVTIVMPGESVTISTYSKTVGLDKIVKEVEKFDLKLHIYLHKSRLEWELTRYVHINIDDLQACLDYATTFYADNNLIIYKDGLRSVTTEIKFGKNLKKVKLLPDSDYINIDIDDCSTMDSLYINGALTLFHKKIKTKEATIIYNNVNVIDILNSGIESKKISIITRIKDVNFNSQYINEFKEYCIKHKCTSFDVQSCGVKYNTPKEIMDICSNNKRKNITLLSMI